MRWIRWMILRVRTATAQRLLPIPETVLRTCHNMSIWRIIYFMPQGKNAWELQKYLTPLFFSKSEEIKSKIEDNSRVLIPRLIRFSYGGFSAFMSGLFVPDARFCWMKRWLIRMMFGFGFRSWGFAVLILVLGILWFWGFSIGFGFWGCGFRICVSVCACVLGFGIWDLVFDLWFAKSWFLVLEVWLLGCLWLLYLFGGLEFH